MARHVCVTATVESVAQAEDVCSRALDKLPSVHPEDYHMMIIAFKKLVDIVLMSVVSHIFKIS